jgi:hypothetical protein
LSLVFFLAGYVKFAYCVFERLTEKEAGILDVVVKESRSRMVSGKIGGDWLVGRTGLPAFRHLRIRGGISRERESYFFLKRSMSHNERVEIVW